MKLIPFLSKATEPTLSSSSSWPWPYCGNPKTLSFRYETITKSVYVTAESSYTNSSVCELSTDNELGLCTIEQEEDENSSKGLDQSIENVIRGARSSTERLFFDKHIGESTSCILGDQHQLAKINNSSTNINKNECATSNDTKVVLIEMESRDPFQDFKKSMEEIVEASSFNMKDDWDSLHQLLSWYLKFNCETNHGYIIGAFIDLLVSFEFSSASNSSYSSPTPSSSRTCCENDHNSCFETSSATVTTESPISDFSFSSNCSAAPCLLTLIEEEEDDEDAGLDHCLTHYQEENNISDTN
ncbi:Transcription repressor [Heracleum sosnowskyi]|uniref:Transcription repressor n=1 Tax=Heracleum sosnowskyi TaxID=360622 RepID=A0AAD8J6V5_9APIA|nr:Transcription repressor [Heracleum sosnowskyi]